MAQQKRPQRPVYPQDEQTARRTPQRPVYSGEYPPPHQRRKAPSRVDYSGVSPIMPRRKEPTAAPFVNDLPGRRAAAAPEAAPQAPARRQAAFGGQAVPQRPVSAGQAAASAPRRQPVRQRTWHAEAAPSVCPKPHAPVYDQNAGRTAPQQGRPVPKKKRRKKRALTPRQKRLRGILIGGMLCIAALAAGAVFSMKVLFKLSSVEVRQPEEEPTVYSEEQITAALGLEMGTQIFSIDLEQAEKN